MLSNVVIVPGNGEGCSYGNFYPWLATQLRTLYPTLPIRLEPMPDPNTARESIWLPFIIDELGATEGTLLVGHSSNDPNKRSEATTLLPGGYQYISITTSNMRNPLLAKPNGPDEEEIALGSILRDLDCYSEGTCGDTGIGTDE